MQEINCPNCPNCPNCTCNCTGNCKENNLKEERLNRVSDRATTALKQALEMPTFYTRKRTDIYTPTHFRKISKGL